LPIHHRSPAAGTVRATTSISGSAATAGVPANGGDIHGGVDDLGLGGLMDGLLNAVGNTLKGLGLQEAGRLPAALRARQRQLIRYLVRGGPPPADTG
jgi:hypothetical protein